MRSWSDCFADKAEARRRKANHPCGFYMTDEGPVYGAEGWKRDLNEHQPSTAPMTTALRT